MYLYNRTVESQMYFANTFKNKLTTSYKERIHALKYMCSNLLLHSQKVMGESFQDHSRIQDFEAAFPQKVSLKMLN